MAPFKPWAQLKNRFLQQEAKTTLHASLKQYLDNACLQLKAINTPEDATLFLEHLDLLLQSEEPQIQQQTLLWVLEDFARHHRLPASLQPDVFQHIRAFRWVWLAQPLLEWLAAKEDGVPKPEILRWLSELPYDKHPEMRYRVSEALFNRFLTASQEEVSAMMPGLKLLDAAQGDVTDRALQRFPTASQQQNVRIIHLLGQTGRYRAVRPLMRFAEEYPTYLRVVLKALAPLDYEEVDLFFLHCLQKPASKDPIVLMDTIKQVRRRRLRKAVPLLETMFPVEIHSAALINRSINGEIALTMASFGAHRWAGEKLLPEMLLNGVTSKYLKAVEMLGLQEAVPLLKTILLMPETPEMSVIQQQAYRICDSLLSLR